jgi:hypothetical protein
VSWNVNSNATVPIETTITAGPSGVSVYSFVTFTFTASVPNAPFECRINAGPYQPCTSPKSFSYPQGSTQTFYVRAIHPQTGAPDPTPASSTWTVDPSAPVATIVGGPPPVTTATSASFIFQSSAKISIFECRIDAEAVAPCTSPAIYGPLTRAQHQFQVRARDTTGKVGPWAVRTWTVN